MFEYHFKLYYFKEKIESTIYKENTELYNSNILCYINLIIASTTVWGLKLMCGSVDEFVMGVAIRVHISFKGPPTYISKYLLLLLLSFPPRFFALMLGAQLPK